MILFLSPKRVLTYKVPLPTVILFFGWCVFTTICVRIHSLLTSCFKGETWTLLLAVDESKFVLQEKEILQSSDFGETTSWKTFDIWAIKSVSFLNLNREITEFALSSFFWIFWAKKEEGRDRLNEMVTSPEPMNPTNRKDDDWNWFFSRLDDPSNLAIIITTTDEGWDEGISFRSFSRL